MMRLAEIKLRVALRAIGSTDVRRFYNSKRQGLGSAREELKS